MYIDTYSKNFKTHTAMKTTVFMNSSCLGWGEGAEAWPGYKGPPVHLQPISERMKI